MEDRCETVSGGLPLATAMGERKAEREEVKQQRRQKVKE
jgi:hypothetical protein